jgi:hypothetical protein
MPQSTVRSDPSWPYPVVAHGSKLGVHSIRSNEVGQFTQTLVDNGAAFPLVKAVDDLDWLIGIKAVSPATLIVARLTSRYEACHGVADPDADLEEMADDIMAVIQDKLDRNPALRDAVDYWEVVNEPDPPGAAGYAALSQLMILCMERANDMGLRTALFSLCAGTPEWDEMEAMADSGVFSIAREGGHVLALHEGIFSPHDPVDLWWGDPIPGAPEVEGAGALCFRYRYLYHLLQQRREVVPLIVSEWCGYDQSPLSPEEVRDRVHWYDHLAREDYWVWAFCPFTLGPVPPWISHDYEFAYPTLVDYMISIKDEPNALPEAAPPEPEPEPEPCPGLPREQYERVYVLLPPGAGSAWARAVVDASWDERRFTIGGSADDAGIGALNEKSVVAVNPTLWGDDLGLFFETHYPGVRYVALQAGTPAELASRLRVLEL